MLDQLRVGKKALELLAARIVINQKPVRQACGAAMAEVEPAAKCEQRK